MYRQKLVADHNCSHISKAARVHYLNIDAKARSASTICGFVRVIVSAMPEN